MDDLALPDWEPIDLTPVTMLALERLVRGKFGAETLSPLALSGRRKDWRDRGDQDWEIAERAIQKAEKLNQSVVFERTGVRFEGHDKPSTFYRLRIDKRLDPFGPDARSQPDNQIEFYANLFGGSPEMYSDLTTDYAVALSGNALVIYRGIAYAAMVVDRSIDLAEVGAAPNMLATTSACRLRYDPSAVTGIEQ